MVSPSQFLFLQWPARGEPDFESWCGGQQLSYTEMALNFAIVVREGVWNYGTFFTTE